VNQAVSRALWIGTLCGVALCAASTAARALDLPSAPSLAKAGVLALFLTPPARLAVAAGAFWREGSRKHALAAVIVLGALLAAAVRAAR
jgi:hypothetical protein